MQNLVVYGTSALFAVALLPLYATVYIYADSGSRYVSANVYLWRVFRPVCISTAEDGKMQFNGKEIKFTPAAALKAGKALIDNLCLFKFVQLCDFGLQSHYGAYLALFQRMAALPLYEYLTVTGSSCRLKNYTVLNAEHGHVIYCGKAACAVNIVAAVKILISVLRESRNEN